jgi:hypothetical protein
MEDSPYYSRILLRVRSDEGEADAFHESLSLARFRNPVVQAMLPFRRRQTALKGWSRAWRIALVEKDNPQWTDLFDYLL